MIGTNPHWDQFITAHRWAVLTTLRTSGSPVSSLVAYARDADDLVVSTPGRTFKRTSIERDPRINLCIVNDQAPFNFVAVEGTARVETTRLLETTRLVFENIKAFGYEEPADFPGWLASQARVILRIHPERVYGVIR